MKVRNILALTLSVVMVMSAFLAFYSVPPNENQFVPAAGTPSATFDVNVTINPDGSVTNASAVTVSGNTYTLNGNLTGNLTILCSECAINGAGFSVSGFYGNSGIYIANASNVLVSNVTVKNSTHAVEVYNSSYITFVNLTADSSNINGLYATQTYMLILRASNISATSTSVYLEYANSTYFYNNYLTGASTTAVDLDNSNDFNSFNDSLLASAFAFFSFKSSSSYLWFDNLSGAEYGAYISYSENVFITYSNLSDESTDGVFIVYSGVVNLSHDILNESLTSKNAVDLEHGYAPVYMYCDFINTTGDAVDLGESSYGVVISDSYMEVGDVFYAGYSTQLTVLKNDFIYASGDDLVYFDGDVNSNILVENCTIIGDVYSSSMYGIEIYPYESSNVTIVGNTFENIYYTMYFDPYAGADYLIANNSFINSYDTIEIDYLANTTIQDNTFINCEDEAIAIYDSSNTYICDNEFFNTTNYAIDVEYATGDLVISNNVITNYSSNAEGIYIDYAIGGEVFDNSLVNLTYGVHVKNSFDVNCYGNYFFNDNYSIYDSYNVGVNYFGNTIVNSTNESFYSEYSSNLSIYGNTFQNATVYLFDLEDAKKAQIYHNNFINAAGVGSYIKVNSNVFTNWNSSLPVGGNYWGDNPQNGLGTSGIGTDPYILDSLDIDYYPLTAPWDPYYIEFTETGLPAGQTWSVSMGGALISTDTGSITFMPSAAQQVQVPYTVSPIPGYTAASYAGTVALNTGDQTISIVFAQTTYNVTFTESNLPSGTSWSVTLNGVTKTSTTSTVTFSEANGTYDYSIGAVAGYQSSTSSGVLTVNSSPQSVSIPFALATYTLTVTQKGLPSGDSWTLTLNGVQYNSTSDTITIQVTSGTYSVSASGPSGYAVSVVSNLSVSNANTSLSVNFSQTQTMSSGSLLAGIGIGGVVGAVVAALVMMFYTGTGIFTNFKKGKGKTP